MRLLLLTLALLPLSLLAPPIPAAEPPAASPADQTAPEAPPAPPPVVCEVWGFKWEGRWVKHADHCLKTTDLKQAIDYAYEINRYAGWIASTNLPGYCRTTYSYHDTAIPTGAGQPEQSPPMPVYAVWAYKLTGAKWIKSDEYSWDSSKWTADNKQRLVALDLAKRINAVPGWKATTNAPACDIPENQRHAYGGVAIGSPVYYTYGDGESYDWRGLSETNGGWSRHGFRVPSDAERRRIHDAIYEENMRNFNQSMDDFNRSMEELGRSLTNP